MVERGSTRHSPRVDDELESEVESLTRGAPVEARAEEWRQMEAAAEGEPKPDAVVSVDLVELRSTLAISLRPSAFPAGRDRLVDVAREEHAEEDVVAWLQTLPADHTFENVQNVWEALGGEHEARGHSLDAAPSTPEPAVAAPPEAEPAVAAPPQEEGGSLLDQSVRIALAGAAVVVGLTIEAVRIILRKR